MEIVWKKSWGTVLLNDVAYGKPMKEFHTDVFQEFPEG